MTYILIAVFLIILIMMYKRFAPVQGVPCSKVKQELPVVIVDLRDYNISDKRPLSSNAINIPVAYLNRHYHEIPSKNVHVIAQNQIEKNMGIRLLRKNGINVMSYTMSNCTCK
ncbi:sulfurtransferase [Bacillus massiliigorillae]|uniref:sulfurtransferase n=1 Tax=Bacillus massiliigorillae TaxID=1243664 RepID=UPI00039EDD29|nr:sulfurtransferase [Bacillus massiliigorillae]